MIPGGFCFVEQAGRNPAMGFNVIHERSNKTQAIIYVFVNAYKDADKLARECNLEICKRLFSMEAKEIWRLAKKMMAEGVDENEPPQT